jgi:hypothetical protein
LWPILLHYFDFAPGKIIFQAFSLRAKNSCREKSQKSQKKFILRVLCFFAADFHRRFVLKCSREQTGKAA